MRGLHTSQNVNCELLDWSEAGSGQKKRSQPPVARSVSNGT